MTQKPKSPSNNHAHHHKISVWGVAALGVGSMVGAGVFALLGQIAANVGGNTWLIFVIAGISAMFSGYAYSRLCAHFPSRGGVIDFFVLGINAQNLARSLSILYLVTLVLTLAMVSKAFGAYAARFAHDAAGSMLVNVYASAAIIILVLVNLLGAKTVGRVETVLVAVKLLILVLFIVAGTITLQVDKLANHPPIEVGPIFTSIGLAFFAYSGFGMMANASADVAEPDKTMPRAFMLAIGAVAILYIILSLVVLGNVSPDELLKYADTAVAQAAKPVLGHWGFVLITIAALFATTSSIMANLFSTIHVANEMGLNRVLPRWFDPTNRKNFSLGFYVLIAIILILTNLFDLSAIANIASVGFLACYLGVFVACWNKRHSCHANPVWIVIGTVIMTIIFASFIGELVIAKAWGQCLTLAVALGISAVLGWRPPQDQSDKP